jgi:hypothetical protein
VANPFAVSGYNKRGKKIQHSFEKEERQKKRRGANSISKRITTFTKNGEMKAAILTLLFVALCVVCLAQQTPDTESKPADFNKRLSDFEVLFDPNNKFGLPYIYAEDYFKVEPSDTPIEFDISTIVLDRPKSRIYNHENWPKNIFGETLEKFPISLSAIYQERLISLFEPGVFVCHSIPSMERDTAFEDKINTKKFSYHWVVNGELVGLSKGRYYVFNADTGWTERASQLPIKDWPILYDDDDYLCFCDNKGEWGGTIYFFNKATGKIYYTGASGANTVYKNNGSYFVLPHSGHFEGFTGLKEISDPSKLSETNMDEINRNQKPEINALGTKDKSKASRMILDYAGIEFLSSFIRGNKTIYIVRLRESAFLAEIDNNVIKIVNPLFNNNLYYHDPITRVYGDTTLINLDFWAIAREREISGIIIQGNTLIKYNWKQQRNKAFHPLM